MSKAQARNRRLPRLPTACRILCIEDDDASLTRTGVRTAVHLTSMGIDVAFLRSAAKGNYQQHRDDAGATSGAAYSFGDFDEVIGDHARIGEGADGKTHPVGEKNANRWGLYDMHGNVCEWCQDWHGAYPLTVVNPLGQRFGTRRVCRGGCFGSVADNCRSSCRYGVEPSLRAQYFGFRVAMSLPAKQPESASTK